MVDTDKKNLVEQTGKFSVVVPVLNSKAHLRASLDSILVAIGNYGNAELIVLDNGSDDGSYEILLKEYSGRVTIQQICGIPVSALRNRGASMCDGEFIAFVDSDCTVVPDYFTRALHILRTYGDATGSQQALEDDSPHWIERTWHAVHVALRDEYVRTISAANFVVKRQAFFAVDGFDEDMISCEDDDLGLRLNKAGFKLYQSASVRVIHLGADDSLRVFFFKSAWRSMGMFRMMKHGWVNKPVLITFAHLALCIAAVANLFVHRESMLVRIIVFAVLVNVAPMLTILYRKLQTGRPFYAPFRLAFLYQIFFLARFYTMGKMIAFRKKSPQRKIAMSARLHNSARAPR
jgi:glycosyltransferase involved in cell wall biosynthesis